jgi:hypothetical protein
LFYLDAQKENLKVQILYQVIHEHSLHHDLFMRIVTALANSNNFS